MDIQGYAKRHLFSHIKRSYRMLLIILIIDLIPLYGVLYLGWGTMDAVYLYFFETLILCVITYMKMRKAERIVAFAKWQKRLAKKAATTTGQAGKLANQAVKRRFGWLRGLISFSYLLINIPLCLLTMMLMLFLNLCFLRIRNTGSRKAIPLMV